MGIGSFSSFEGPDFAAFIVCAVIGFFVGTFVPAGAPAIYTSILVSYHLFLGWLVFGSAGQIKAGVSLPVVHTVVTHAACLIVIIAPVAIAIAGHTIPLYTTPQDTLAGPADSMTLTAEMELERKQRNAYHLFQALCCSMAGLAVFERRWLFSSEAPEVRRPDEPMAAPQAIRATAEDAAEWSRYLAAKKPGPRRPGISLKDEYEQWLAARYRGPVAQVPEEPRRG